MKQLYKRPWIYTLYEDNGTYTLSVLCGSAAIYKTEITLTAAQVAQYQRQGIPYLDSLAAEIQNKA